MSVSFGNSLSKNHLDAAGDDPAQARVELEAIIDRLNNKLVNVTILTASDKTGNDSGIVSGTAGTDGDLGLWNSDGDLVSIAKTSANTASTVVERDANGRSKFADPSAAQDAGTKAYIDQRAAKAWARFDMTGTIGDSFGVSSVTDNGSGSWRVNLSTNFATADYASLADGNPTTTVSVNISIGTKIVDNTAYDVFAENSNGNLTDLASGQIHTVAFGAQ